jgi:hypothetical protein
MSTLYHGLLGLDKLPNNIKLLNWIICFVLTVLATISSYRIYVYAFPPQISRESAELIAWVSPACIAAAWLRITGISWRSILLFLVLVPPTSFLTESMIGMILYIRMGL